MNNGWSSDAPWPTSSHGYAIIDPPKPKTSELMRQDNLRIDAEIKQSWDDIKNVGKEILKLVPQLYKQHITIPEQVITIDKPKEVDCIIVGDLGIYEEAGWNVIHIPTLMQFNRAVPHVEPTLEQLLEWCRLVQTDHKEDWEALKQFGPNIDKDETVELRQRIMRHCQMMDI